MVVSMTHSRNGHGQDGFSFLPLVSLRSFCSMYGLKGPELICSFFTDLSMAFFAFLLCFRLAALLLRLDRRVCTRRLLESRRLRRVRCAGNFLLRNPKKKWNFWLISQKCGTLLQLYKLIIIISS